jgi:hypothetical protein
MDGFSPILQRIQQFNECQTLEVEELAAGITIRITRSARTVNAMSCV